MHLFLVMIIEKSNQKSHSMEMLLNSLEMHTIDICVTSLLRVD